MKLKWKSWEKLLQTSPLLVVGLLFYMALPTRIIFPDFGSEPLQAWQPGYFGWYDLVLVATLVIGIALSEAHVPPTLFAFGGVILACIVVSILSNGMPLDRGPLVDGLVYWLRFIVPFVGMICLVQKGGEGVATGVLVAMSLVLMISALFVFQLQYGTFNRIYASGMTVGSFSQGMMILFVVAMIRNNKALMGLSMIFLILTFSRTALILWAISVGYYFVSRTRLNLLTRLVSASAIMGLFALAMYFLIQNPEFAFVIDERLSAEEFSSFNNRASVWGYGVDLLRSGSVPVTGIGFNMTPSVLRDYALMSPDGSQQYFPSFHSILLEYGIGLGILALPLFAVLLWRIFLTWKWKCRLSFFIFALFFLSQSFDFTFYRPKEVILWAVFLGLAEGHWRAFVRSRAVSRTAVVSKIVRRQERLHPDLTRA